MPGRVVDNLRVFRLRVGLQRILECLGCLHSLLRVALAAGLHSNLSVIGAVVPTSSCLRVFRCLRASGLHSNLRFPVGRSLRLPVCLGVVGVLLGSVLRFPLLGLLRVGLRNLRVGQRFVFLVTFVLRFLVECLNRLHRKMLAGERQRFRR